MLALATWVLTTAIAAAPAVTITPVRDGAVGPLAGCRILLEAPAGGPSPRVLPCAPLRLEAGRYTAWIEADHFISREEWQFDHPGAESAHRSAVVPAGRARVDMSDLESGARVRLFSLAEAFSRAVPRGGTPVLMPAGKAVAVAFDVRDRVIAVSAPVTVSARQLADIELSAPARSALAIRALPENDEPFELVRDARFLPDLFLPRIGLAVWYAVDAADTSVEVRSERLYMPPLPVTLRRNAVAFEEVRLKRKPSLTVRLDGTAEVLRELLPATVALQAAGDAALLRKAEVTTAEHSFAFVPPAVLRCVLEAGPVKLEQRADLSAGEDAAVTFLLDPFEVSGRITHGGKHVRGEVEFRGGGEETRVETEADGTYSVRLWQAGKYVVEVRITEPPLQPTHTDLVDVDEDTASLDIDIPDSRVAVRVVDESDGKPIARAHVTTFNTWNEAEAGRRRAGRTVIADERGEALLPPLRSGEVVVHAAAQGYREVEPLRFAAPESGSEMRRFEIALRRRETGSVQLRLPDGSPAPHAELHAVSADGRELGARADAAGRVAVPADFAAGVLLIRHATGHVAAVRWPSAADELVLQLRGVPLVVRAENAAGEPSRFTTVALWIHGVRLTQPALAFLADGATMTDAGGVWVARSVPPVPIRIAAARSGQTSEAAVLTAFATDVAAPWPPVIIVKVQ
jgi:hypothetical protein